MIIGTLSNPEFPSEHLPDGTGGGVYLMSTSGG